MHRTDNSRFLLFIELPANKKRLNPINDGLTRIMHIALKYSEKGLSDYKDVDSNGIFKRTNRGYMGVHYTECGEHSSNLEYLLENGMITNSLAPFYLAYYRNRIPFNEIKKTIRLYLFYHLDENQAVLNFINRYLPFILWFLLIRYWVIYKLLPYRKPLQWCDYDDDDDDPLIG
jgi:hypothetical protein